MCGKFKCGNDHLKLNADLILDNAPVTAPCADSIFEENDDLMLSIADDAVDFALANLLENADLMGFDSISVTQTAKELNDATVDFRLEILAGNVEIEGMEVGKEGNKIVVPVDSLLVWSIANAKTISNNYGEIKIDKDITTERIDPIDAIIDAWKHAMKEEYRPDVNETVNEWLEQYEKYMKKGGEK